MLVVPLPRTATGVMLFWQSRGVVQIKSWKRERDREKERECAHVGVFVCGRERHQGKRRLTGHNVQFFFFCFFLFFFFVPQAAKEAKVPPRCSAQPHTPTSFKSPQPTDLQNTQIYITMWPLRALNHRELHAVVREKTNPTTSLMLPHFAS